MTRTIPSSPKPIIFTATNATSQVTSNSVANPSRRHRGGGSLPSVGLCPSADSQMMAERFNSRLHHKQRTVAQLVKDYICNLQTLGMDCLNENLCMISVDFMFKSEFLSFSCLHLHFWIPYSWQVATPNIFSTSINLSSHDLNLIFKFNDSPSAFSLNT